MYQEGKISNTNKTSVVLLNSNKTIIHIGEVVDINDDTNEGRIRVRVPGIDNSNETSFSKKKEEENNPYFKVTSPNSEKTEITSKKTKKLLDNSLQQSNLNGGISPNAGTEIVWAIPLLPKHLQILPKVGEKVKLIFFDMGNGQLNRAWIGPLVSQKTNLNYQDKINAGNILNTSRQNGLLKNVSGDNKLLRTGNKKIGDFRGGFPDKEDIAIMGRNNADIILPTAKGEKSPLNSGGEILIRAGKFNFNEKNQLSLNIKNPGYLRIKVIKETSIANVLGRQNNDKTMSMLFSDYISLVAYDSNLSGKPFVTDVNPIMNSDTKMLKTHTELSPLVRCDVLVEFLKLLIDYVQNHNHPYHKLPATNANSKNAIEEFDLERLLSQGIRIN